MRIKIDIINSVPKPNKVPQHAGTNFKEKCLECIQTCESDMDSDHEWKYLRAAYNKLVNQKNLKPEYSQLLDTIESFILKHNSVASGDNYINIDRNRLLDKGDRE